MQPCGWLLQARTHTRRPARVRTALGGAGTRELGPGRALNPQEALRAGACRGGGNQLASPFHGKIVFCVQPVPIVWPA